MTSRELVYNTLSFKNHTQQIPRQMWVLPWAWDKYGETIGKIQAEFPDDIITAQAVYNEPPKQVGDPYKKGIYIDPWGCTFENIHEGIIGEVKQPMILQDDDDWDSVEKVHLPYEYLSFDTDRVNEFCAASDKFILADFYARPFEQLQFIRGTENLFVDLMDPPPKMLEFIAQMHKLYCEIFEKWAKTDVDALFFMDDWGSQNSLLISPALWCKFFKPLYKDYIDIAHKYGKKIFMHSDGYTLDIIPHLIELGLDALNCQIFCMGADKLEQFKGKLTFWGEIDRQRILPYGSEDDVKAAVHKVYKTLWDNGGCIAQLEFGPGAKPENVYRAFSSWAEIG